MLFPGHQKGWFLQIDCVLRRDVRLLRRGHVVVHQRLPTSLRRGNRPFFFCSTAKLTAVWVRRCFFFRVSSSNADDLWRDFSLSHWSCACAWTKSHNAVSSSTDCIHSRSANAALLLDGSEDAAAACFRFKCERKDDCLWKVSGQPSTPHVTLKFGVDEWHSKVCLIQLLRVVQP